MRKDVLPAKGASIRGTNLVEIEDASSIEESAAA
jgi:hypothetical protein